MAQQLFAGNLAWTVTSESLTAHMLQAGYVVSAEVQMRPDGKSKGWALVTFPDNTNSMFSNGMDGAIELLNDTDLDGRKLLLRRAEERGAKGKGAGKGKGKGGGGKGGGGKGGSFGGGRGGRIVAERQNGSDCRFQVSASSQLSGIGHLFEFYHLLVDFLPFFLPLLAPCTDRVVLLTPAAAAIDQSCTDMEEPYPSSWCSCRWQLTRPGGGACAASMLPVLRAFTVAICVQISALARDSSSASSQSPRQPQGSASPGRSRAHIVSRTLRTRCASVLRCTNTMASMPRRLACAAARSAAPQALRRGCTSLGTTRGGSGATAPPRLTTRCGARRGASLASITRSASRRAGDLACMVCLAPA